MFETDRIPSGWKRRLNFMDEVWVPTEFSRKIFEAHGVEKNKIKVLAEPVNNLFFKPENISDIHFRYGILDDAKKLNKDEELQREKLKILKEKVLSGTFVFLFVGKWEEIKGIKLLLRAFYTEFSE